MIVVYWISFAFIFALIPIAIISLFTYFKKKRLESGKKLTEGQKKNASVNILQYCIFYWMCDFFYMSCFIRNLILQFIFGCLIMVIIYMNLAIGFTSPNDKNTFERYSLLQDFLVGLGLTVYLLYIIPNSSLQTIVIAIVSAVYGGLITLVGVAWTIRKSDKDRKEDEISKAKPYFSFTAILHEPKDAENTKVCLTNPDDEIGCKYETYVKIENSNQSVLILKKIYHDGKWSDTVMNQAVIPGGELILSFRFNDLLHVYLEVNDYLGNSYFYKVEMLGYPNPFNPAITTSGLKFNTVRGFKGITMDEVNKELSEDKVNDK